MQILSDLRWKNRYNYSLRRLITLAAMAAVAVVSGCKLTGPQACFHIEYGDCTGGQGTPGDSVRVIGFPPDHLDSLNRGVLHVGETVDLKLLVLANAQHYPGDTSHTVRWTLPSGVNAVRLVNDDNGVGRLTAIAPGTLSTVIADGAERPVWAYTNLQVFRLDRIVVVP